MSDIETKEEVEEPTAEVEKVAFAGPVIKRAIPRGFLGYEEPARKAAPAPKTGYKHLPLGKLPRVTADWYDEDRVVYPTRGDIPKQHTERTPTKFNPNELPDPRGAYAMRVYPQVVPADQVDPRHKTHSL